MVRSEQWVSLVDVLKAERLPEVNEEITGRHRELIDNVEKADSLKTILDLAYSLEREARDAYNREAQRTTSSESRSVFSKMARFEEGHMKKIERMREEYVR